MQEDARLIDFKTSNLFMRSFNELLAKEAALFFVLAVCFVFTILWIFFLLSSSPLPISDDWLLAADSRGFQDFNWDWIWALHGEHRYPIIKFLMVSSANLGFWQFPRFLSVLVCSATCLFLVFRVREIRGKTVWADAVFPVCFLHAGHATNFFWTLQFSSFLAICLVCVIASLLIEKPRKNSSLHAWITAIALVILPLNSAVGLLFTPILGAAFFIRGVYAWRKWGISPISPLVATVIAAVLCVLYVSGLGSRSQMMPEFLSVWDKLGNVIACAALGLGMYRWQTLQPLGFLVLFFNLMTMGILAYLWRKSVISGIVLFSGSMVLGACWILPISIGFSRFADTRYVTVACGIIVVPLLFWAIIEKQSVYLKKIGILFQASLLLFLLAFNSFSAAINFEKQRLVRAENLLGHVRAGTPLEIIASRFASQIIPWNSPKYSEYVLKRLKGTSFLNMEKLKEWREVFSTAHALLPLKNVMCTNMEKITDNANTFAGDSTDSMLTICLPRKEYVRAIYLAFNLTGNPQFTNSHFSVSWVGADAKPKEQACLMNGYSNPVGLDEHVWIWVDSDIKEFSVQPRKNSKKELFLFEVTSIKLYQK